MASPLVLAVFKAVVVEENATDAVTGETITDTDRDYVVFSPSFSCGGLWGNIQRCTSLSVLQPSGDKSTVPCVLSSHRISWDYRRL